MKITNEVLDFLVRKRVKKWCEVIGLCKEEDDCIWDMNPAGVILKHFNASARKLIEIKSDLVGFVKGSFSLSDGGKQLAGVGGLLKDGKGNLMYMFSGPAQASFAYETEEKALVLML